MSTINFDFEKHHFQGELPESLDNPITITLQTTRLCNLHCIYCSEDQLLSEPSKGELEDIIDQIKDVKRVIVSGGEPLLRKDAFDLLGRLKDQEHIVALATNGTRINKEVAGRLVGLVDYVDLTIDGPRKIHNMIRGNYDKIMEGILNLREQGVEYSIVTVLVPQNLDYLEDICQVVDTLGGRKQKILTPIPKGRGKEIYKKTKGKYLLDEVFDRLKTGKETKSWSQRITLTDWRRIGEGHALLIHPDGNVVASPIFSGEEAVEYIGNLHKESLGQLWDKFQHKEEHFKKYLEKSLYVC
ncbi:MAG: radical SAM protein [Nanoarchaeota archaeon]